MQDCTQPMLSPFSAVNAGYLQEPSKQVSEPLTKCSQNPCLPPKQVGEPLTKCSQNPCLPTKHLSEHLVLVHSGSVSRNFSDGRSPAELVSVQNASRETYKLDRRLKGQSPFGKAHLTPATFTIVLSGLGLHQLGNP
eukprot:scaffold274362_cov15-Tisochrysis_lutea.AAC.1